MSDAEFGNDDIDFDKAMKEHKDLEKEQLKEMIAFKKISRIDVNKWICTII